MAVAVAEPGFPACSCFECTHPTTSNIETRLVHRDRHEEFANRCASRVTDTERGMWTALKILDALEQTEPVGSGQCRRPDHAMLITHPAHIR